MTIVLLKGNNPMCDFIKQCELFAQFPTNRGLEIILSLALNKMTVTDKLNQQIVRSVFPKAQFEKDNDGQTIIYTNDQ